MKDGRKKVNFDGNRTQSYLTGVARTAGTSAALVAGNACAHQTVVSSRPSFLLSAYTLYNSAWACNFPGFKTQHFIAKNVLYTKPGIGCEFCLKHSAVIQ